MKLFNFESFKKINHQEKPLTDKEIENENNPTHEEKDRKNLQTKDLQTENFQAEVFEEEQRLAENNPEKNFIPIEEISDNIDWESYILEQIENPKSNDEELEEIKGQTNIHKPQEVKDIIKKYSLPTAEWQRLTSEKKAEIKRSIQEEIRNLYIRQPKKMVRKKNDKEMAA